MTRHTVFHAVNMAHKQDTAHPPPGFYAVVCTPALLADRDDNVLDALRPVVATSRGGVLINAPSRRNRGCVLITGRLPTGDATAPALWIGPVRAATDVEVLADWLAIGGPLAPVPDRRLELKLEVLAAHTGLPHIDDVHALHDRPGSKDGR